MKLTVNIITGLVAVKAVKDSGMNLTGDIFGLRPLNAAEAINAGQVVEADHDPAAQTRVVEVDGDTVTEVEGASDPGAKAKRTPKDQAQKPPSVDPPAPPEPPAVNLSQPSGGA